MAGKYKIELRDLSRDSVNQLNKNFDKIENDITAKGGGTAPPKLTVVPSPSGPVNLGGSIPGSIEDITNVNKGGGSPGPVGPPGPPSPVFTDGVTIGGDGNGTPLFSFVLSSFLVVTNAFAASPYSATLEEQQVTYFRCSSSAGADFVFDLPAATGSGNVAVIKKSDANAHNIAVTPNGSDTIDGVNAVANISIQYSVLRLVDVTTGAWETW